MRTHTAMLTSQLQPIPRKNIWCHSGVTAFLLRTKRGKQPIDMRLANISHVSWIEAHTAKEVTNSLYGAVEIIPESSGVDQHMVSCQVMALGGGSSRREKMME